MRPFWTALLFGLGGYVVGVLGGVVLVGLWSSNADKSEEAVMTGFFFLGPLVAVLACIGSVVYQMIRRRYDGRTVGR